MISFFIQINSYFELKVTKIFEIANNAIYFRDNSDYLTALYEICHVINPDDESVGERNDEENN